MFGRAHKASVPVVPDRPHLDLSGPRLRRALEALVAGADTHGGIERYMDALKLKSAVFREALAADGPGARRLDVESFRPLCAFMPTVRRRIVPWLEEPSYTSLRRALDELLEPTSDTSGTDARIARFCAGFPPDDRSRCRPSAARSSACPPAMPAVPLASASVAISCTRAAGSAGALA